jgi:murein DD-endopeptidase MepM/ murein hydrolase activator NlpD
VGTRARHRRSVAGTTTCAMILAGTALTVLAPSAGATVQVARESDRDALGDAVKIGLTDPESGQAKEENAALAELAALAEQRVAEILKNAWQLSIARGTYHLTAGFGECSSLWSHCHTGLDFAAPEGTPILAVANGVVTETGWAGAYGNRTIMTLEDGTELWYCHQSAFGVKPGQQVIGGQPIGLVGATGNTTGPHLHLEVRPGGGDPVDPQQALVVHGVTP